MLRVEVPAETASLRLANDVVIAVAEQAGLSEERCGRLRLAVEELFTNTVNHGYGEAVEGCAIVVEGGVTEDTVWVRLIDTAPRFDPTAAPEPAGLDLPLQEREPGGLGLFLAHRAVDELRHRYADGANHTMVVLRRTSGDGQGLDG
jgi:serine/threonine-protein kinase RsbW